jgi:S1-C subfamily serine protease
MMVLTVEPGSPAARSGLKEHDVIVGFDGQPIAGIDDLQRQLTDDCVSRHCTLTVIRHTEKLDLTIQPAESR